MVSKLTNALRILAAAAVFFSITTACSRTPKPIPPGADTKYYGYIASGEKFGVRIGDTKSKAEAALISEGFKVWQNGKCSYYLKALVDCTDWTQVELFSLDQRLYRGNLYLKIEEDRVSAIVWDMHLLPHVDL